MRPLEQSLAAVPGLEQINSTANEGSGQVRLNFAWGTDLNEAADEVRTRVDRVRGRLPQEADTPSIQKFDSAASPIMSIGVEGDFDRVTLRELAETRPRAAARARRGRRRGDGQRRPAPADPRRAVEGKDHGARPLGRSRRQHDPHGEPEHPARRGLRGRHDLPAPERRASSQNLEQIKRPHRPDEGRRPGLPPRHRRRPGHDRRPALVHAHQRQARRADAGDQAVGQEHGRDRGAGASKRSSGSTAKCRP